jgi:hypothetical protein
MVFYGFGCRNGLEAISLREHNQMDWRGCEGPVETGDSMKTSWQIERGGLLCRWFNSEERIQYNVPWLQEASTETYGKFVEPIPDFAAHSPLGSGEWFVPWDARWSVPRPFSE